MSRTFIVIPVGFESAGWISPEMRISLPERTVKCGEVDTVLLLERPTVTVLLPRRVFEDEFVVADVL